MVRTFVKFDLNFVDLGSHLISFTFYNINPYKVNKRAKKSKFRREEQIDLAH
jgi:hypothetical protein